MPDTSGGRASSPSNEATADGNEIQEIVVTGSRLKTGFATPTPVTMVSAEQLQHIAPNNIAEALTQLPALNASLNGTNAGGVSAAAATNGQSLLNLRNLGANRTLVLLDGNVLPVTNSSGSTDINIIPQVLIQRVDVVTGGASATYGSDAVAGVVNFVLNTHFQGFQANLDGGETTYGDGQNRHLSLAYGTSFAGNRGRLVSSIDLFQEDGIGLPPTGRNWFDNAYGAYPNPVTGAQPSTLVVPNVRSSAGTYGGLITSGPLKGQQFGPGGVLESFSPGTNAGPNFASGGEGAYVVNGLSPKEDREGFFLHGEYDLSDRLTVFAEGMYSRSHAVQIGAPPFEYGSKFQFTIFNNNAYLPPAVAAMFAANPAVTSFTMGRFSQELTPITNDDLTTLGRLAVGVKGELTDRWSFDVNLMQSRTNQDLDQPDTINRNLYAAADAVVNPANGRVVCRSTLSGLDPGCVPINLFGPNSISAAGASYVDGVQEGDLTVKQTAFNANLRGDLGDTLRLDAGPISLAVGAAYRRDDADRTVTPLSDTYTSCAGLRGCPKSLDGIYGGYQSYNPTPLNGRVGATEGFVEFGVPIVKNILLVKALDLDLAARLTEFDIAGSSYPATSWKVGPSWQVDDQFRLRYARSQDFRAPDISELFSGGTSATSNFIFPSSTAPSPFTVASEQISVGNTALRPEKALTTTIGGVFTPSWLHGLQASVDYYKIGIENAIAAVTSQQVIDGCYAGNAGYCSLVYINNGSVPISNIGQITPTTSGIVVKSPTLNLQSIRTSGIDLELADTHSLLGGNLTTRVLGNYLLTAYSSANAPNASILVGTNGVGSTGAGAWPRWTGTLSAQFDHPIFRDAGYSLYAQERFISAGQANPNLAAGVSISQNDVPMIAYTDVTATYKFAFLGAAEAYFNVTNLFNREPPVTVTASSSFENPTNYQLYDVLGRRFVLGLRVKM